MYTNSYACFIFIYLFFVGSELLDQYFRSNSSGWISVWICMSVCVCVCYRPKNCPVQQQPTSFVWVYMFVCVWILMSFLLEQLLITIIKNLANLVEVDLVMVDIVTAQPKCNYVKCWMYYWGKKHCIRMIFYFGSEFLVIFEI